MNNELKQIEQDDVLVDFVSSMEQRGCRSLLLDLKSKFPQHFAEVVIQLDRIKAKQVPKLLVGD